MQLNRNKVVIIGDDAVSLYVIRELLVDEHLDVVTLRRGTGTLSLVRSILPDLILLDNAVAASSGDEIRETLGRDEELRTIPLFQCSSADGDGLRKRVRRFRTMGYTSRGDAFRLGNSLAKSLAGTGP
jgi:CheY-like chemotaxis protein